MHQVFRFVARVALSFLAVSATFAAQQSTFVGPPSLMALPQGRVAWATTERDAGEVDAGLRLTHLVMLLKRPPERQQAFEELLKQQQDPASPNFHQWLSPTEVGKRFGAAAQDIEAIKAWLASRGLRVDGVSNSLVRIRFSGSAGDVGAAFAAPLHAYAVNGEKRIAPATLPRMPENLASLVEAVDGLETTDVHPHNRQGPAEPVRAEPDLTNCSSSPCTNYITPSDFATIYDVNSAYLQGITGRGQSIAIIGRSRVYFPDIENFQMRTNLAVQDPIEIVPPGGVEPGPAQSIPPTDISTLRDQLEATLDVTRAGSVATGATIKLIVSGNTATLNGIAIAGEYAVDADPIPAQVMNVSFGACEQNAGVASLFIWYSIFTQAAAEGISAFVSSGDAGAAGCDKAFTAPPASQVANPNYICAAGYATCVGGTQFADTANPDAYWIASSSASHPSATGYIPEGAWNEPIDSKGNVQVSGTGGGESTFVPAPSWQAGLAPAGGGRLSPDVSFSAARHDAYFVCVAAASGPCSLENTGSYHFQSDYGTSAAAPSMAGIAALLNQKTGKAQGNLNPRLYALATTPSNGVFHDVTVASSGVDSCSASVPSLCNNSTSGANGAAGLSGALVGPGYDRATGLGSIDVGNLLSNWASAVVPGQLDLALAVLFNPQPVGAQSASVQTFILNIGDSPVTISRVGGTNVTEFPASSNCVTTLAPRATCEILVSFAPTATGTRTGVISITSSGPGSPQVMEVAGTGVAPNYQGLWWAAPAASESGWGINFAHQADTIFATWFTYDLSGAGNWLVMTAPKTSANTYSGTLYSTTGPAFSAVPFNPLSVTAKAEGTGTLTFTDLNNATFAYTVGTTSQTKAITREVFGTMPTCISATSTANLTSATNYTDLWWASPAASESGWGINLTHEGATIFASWFTYDANGKPMWLVATAPLAGGSYTGTIYRTTGPAFNSVPFNPQSVAATSVGSATFTFADGNNATFAYTVNGISQSKHITREIFSGSGTVCN